MSSPQSSKNERLSRAFDVLIVGVSALFLALPMLVYGPMVKGDDTYEHLNYSRHFAEQFWAGEWYPRWLLNINHGLGSPTFFVYPPFGSYVYALLQPLGRALHFNPFSAGEFLALFGSGICAWLWATTFAQRKAALVGAMLYMLIPYHLAEDFYRRTALSECWALAWMPLVLYFTTGVIARKRFALLGLAVAYALLITSHLVSVLIFSLIPLALVLVMASPGEKVSSGSRIVAGMALGTGLSCFYFIPALSQAAHFPVIRALCPPYYYLESNLIGIRDIVGSGMRSRYVHWIAIATVSTLTFIAICGGALLWLGRPELRRKVGFWLGACVIPVFLMSTFSLPLWSPKLLLFQGVQYPWRFNIILCLAAVFIGATFLSEIPKFWEPGHAAILGILLLLVLSWLVSYGQIWRHYRTDVYVPNPRQLVSDDDGWFDSWTAPGVSQANALRASAEPPVRFVEGIGTSQLRLWKARDIEFDTDSSTGGWVEINQFYYPKWTASALGTPQPLEIETAMPEGLVKVKVPAGHEQIRVAIPVQPGERLGRWISFASILLCGIMAWRERSADVSGVLSRSQIGSSQSSMEGMPA